MAVFGLKGQAVTRREEAIGPVFLLFVKLGINVPVFAKLSFFYRGLCCIGAERMQESSPMRADFFTRLQGELDDISAQGLTKFERQITSAQSGEIRVTDGTNETAVLNFCCLLYTSPSPRD